MSTVLKRIEAMGIELPKPATAVANYVPAVLSGSLLVVSGQLPFGPDGKILVMHTGRLTIDSPIERAKEAAELCAINILAHVRAALGDMDRVKQVLRLGGYFAVDGAFDMMPAAMNGASNIIAGAFGDRGRHARTTVGVAHLPLHALCEVEAMFEIEPWA